MAKKKFAAPPPIRSDSSGDLDLMDIYTDKPVETYELIDAGAFSELSEDERQTLADCQSVIEQGMQTFIEVGNALMTIRSQKLYRESHRTFEEYVGEKFDLQRRRAYQLIEAAEVVGRLKQLDLPLNDSQGADLPLMESHARAMSGLDDEELGQAWQEVQQENKIGGKPLSTEKIKAVADRIKGKPPKRPVSKKKAAGASSNDDNLYDSDEGSGSAWLTPKTEITQPGAPLAAPLSGSAGSDSPDNASSAEKLTNTHQPVVTQSNNDNEGHRVSALQPIDEQTKQTIQEAVKMATGQDITVTVYGSWLIRQGLAQHWHQLRNRDPDLEDEITDGYRDTLIVEEARQMGLI